MTERVMRWTTRQLRKGLLAIAYLVVVLPAAGLIRWRRQVVPLRPDPGMSTYWIEKGRSGDPAEAFSSHEGIVVLRSQSAIGGYVRSVASVGRGRRVVPALLAALLTPLRWAKPPEGPRIDPDIYAMH